MMATRSKAPSKTSRTVVHRALAAIALCAAMAAAPAFGATFCVHTASEFATAILDAEGNGEGDTIKLATGTYALSGQLNYQSSDDGLELSGGWDAACAQRALNALNTVLDGGNTYLAFFFSNGTLLLDGINFDRIPIQQMAANNMVLRHDIFTGDQGTDGVQVQSSSGTVLFDSNVFDHKNVEIGSYDSTDSNPITWHVVNNTILNAVVGASDEINRKGYGLYLNEPGQGGNLHIVLANNVLWNNATGGIHIDRYPEVFATHNNWQSLTNADNVGLANGSGANSNADPQLAGNCPPTVPGSPAINSGTITFPGGIGALDLGGGARVVGTTPDRGAYESAVDDSATLVVSTNADTGVGSLRAALDTAANAPNPQRIEFNLSSCPKIINVNSALPAIVDTLTIDGYTQPGAKANTLATGSDARICVILRGNYASSEGLVANNLVSHATVRGLAFANFGIAAIDFSDGDSHVIEGNQFGGTLAFGASGSLALEANARGIRLHQDTSGSFVGGIDPQQRNVVDGCNVYGVSLIGNYGGHQMRNNYIGLAPNGSTVAGNTIGLIVASANNLIDRNFISGSAQEGVQLQGNPTFMGYPQANALTDNVIGLPAIQGVDLAQNFGAGVRVTANAIGNVIGSDTNGQISANLIVGNGQNGFVGPGTGYGGVSVESGNGNRISGNRIYANYGLAIDLGNNGPTPNDATDVDTGANQLQNFPALLAIRHVDGARRLSGSIYISTSTKIEVFASPQCHGSGRVDAAYALSTNARALIPPIGGGTTNFSLNIARGPGMGVDAYCRLGATATDADGNTSEMSACFVDDTVFAHGFDSGTGFSCAP